MSASAMALFNAFIVGLVGLFAAGALAMAPNAPYCESSTFPPAARAASQLAEYKV